MILFRLCLSLCVKPKESPKLHEWIKHDALVHSGGRDRAPSAFNTELRDSTETWRPLCWMRLRYELFHTGHLLRGPRLASTASQYSTCVWVCVCVHVCMRPHWPLLVKQTLHQCVWQTDRYYINLHGPYCDVLFIMKMIDGLAWINVCGRHLLRNTGCVGVFLCVGVRGKKERKECGHDKLQIWRRQNTSAAFWTLCALCVEGHMRQEINFLCAWSKPMHV